MKRKHYVRLIGIVLLLLLAAIPAYIYWQVFTEHVYDPGPSSAPADITHYTSVAPPAEAREIRVATLSYGQARATFVRFTASPDVCQKYAAAVMPNKPLMELTENQKYDDAMSIYANARSLPDLRWMDLPYVQSFWSLQAGQPVFARPDFSFLLNKTPQIIGADENWELKGYLATSVRVDTARGIFYFLQLN